jgi:hypothetical protein
MVAKIESLKVPVEALPGSFLLRDVIAVIEKRIEDNTVDDLSLPDGIPWGVLNMAGFLVSHSRSSCPLLTWDVD